MADFGPRKDAEIRRMASHKTAAELLKIMSRKGSTEKELTEDELWSKFKALAQLLDEDAIEAGQVAIDELQEQETVVEANANGSNTDPDIKLNDLQQQKMLQYLNEYVTETTDASDKQDGAKISQEVFKLKLWTMHLPNVISHKDLVKRITLEQGMTLHGWVKETLEQTPNPAA